MPLLLDTNIVLPIINERLRELDSRIRDAVAAPEVALHVSVASLWEIAIKVRLGKLELKPSPSELPSLLSDLGMSLLRIEASHVLAEVLPAPVTRDPFDRLLLGQCLVEGMRLATLDRALAAHPLAWRPA